MLNYCRRLEAGSVNNHAVDSMIFEWSEVRAIYLSKTQCCQSDENTERL